jgi:hypothetical protein
MGYNAVYFVNSPKYWRNISPPSSGLRSKPSKKPTETVCRLVKVIITTNIPVKRMAGRLEGNIGKYAVVGSVTAGVGLGGVNPWDFFPWPQDSK